LSLFCNNCGSPNKEEARFCSDCGQKLVTITESGTLSPEVFLDRRYKIIRLVKSGGMGAVYEAEDERFCDRCAVKEMSLHYSLPEEKKYFTDKFRQEARILRTLHHKSLPRVTDYFSEHGRYYLVMDFVDGSDLETILGEKGSPGLDIKEVVSYSIEVLEVLNYLHNSSPPILYRDLKPSNIMIRKSDNKIMLVDFGIARAITQETPSTQTRVGTPNYAAPEQFTGRNEEASDIYSLAATMHHLITGQIPVPCLIPPIRHLKPDVPEELERILGKALNPHIIERYSSAEEMKKELEKFLTIYGGSRITVPFPGQTTEKPSCKHTENMIFIPAGEALMGQNEEREYPKHRVYLDSYYIDRYPVTNRDFDEFVRNTGYMAKGKWRSHFSENSLDHPVIDITWFDAKNFADWKGKILPTEAEWEKAAGGTEGFPYPWGNESDKNKCNNRQMDRTDGIKNMINISDGRGTTRVDTFLEGSAIYGVMDMAGNVKEWCSDWYSAYYYSNSGSAVLKNPHGPKKGDYKVIKGGSWKSDLSSCTCSKRNKLHPNSHEPDIGFRCVKPIKKKEI
jgi:serine/threonine-protein kinase